MDSSTLNLQWDEGLKDYLVNFKNISDSIIKQGAPINDITSILQIMLTSEEIKDMRQNREERKSYASYIFFMICFYLVIVFVLLFFSGFNCWGFYLSDKIVLSLIGTTLINVLGVFIIVVNYLFPRKR